MAKGDDVSQVARKMGLLPSDVRNIANRLRERGAFDPYEKIPVNAFLEDLDYLDLSEEAKRRCVPLERLITKIVSSVIAGKYEAIAE
jgi:hypothetical protein